MNKLDKKPGFSRDILLIVIGALMSFITTIYTLKYSSDKEDKKYDLATKKEETNAKITFTKELGDNCGHRLFLINEIYKSRKNNNKLELKRDLDLYFNARDLWNQKIQSYYPLLNIYFGPEKAKLFDSTIYVPTLALGKQAVDTTLDIKQINLQPRFDTIRVSMSIFFDSLFSSLIKINNN